MLRFEAVIVMEKIMRKRYYCEILALFVFMVAPGVWAKQVSTAYQQGTVLKVRREEVSSPSECCYSGTDAPLQSQYYAYEVSLRVGCSTYRGRYETPFDYFPSAFKAGQSVSVRLTKHVMNFDVPGENNLKVNIVHRSSDQGVPCTATAGR